MSQLVLWITGRAEGVFGGSGTGAYLLAFHLAHVALGAVVNVAIRLDEQPCLLKVQS